MYREIPPSPQLKNIIDTFWVFEGHETGLITPDASMDIIFSLDDGTSNIFGIATHSTVVSFEENVRLLGVRFHPGMFQLFVSTPLHDLKNQIIDAERLFPSIGEGFLEDFLEKDSIPKKIFHIENFLLQKIQSYDRDTHVTLSCLSAIRKAHGNISIREVTEGHALSERTLERKFRERIGITMKEMARIIRFNETVQMLTSDTSINLSRLAQNLGYYDQSHLCHEFQLLSGMNPNLMKG